MANNKKNYRKDSGKYERKDKCKSGKGTRFEESTKDDLKGKTNARNDAGWYMADSVLMKDAANLPFPNALGMPMSIRDGMSNVLPVNTSRVTVPGIMRVSVITTPGTVGTWNDPINVAIRDIYSFVRHQNSGSKNYDAADLGVYFYAYDSCATYYAYLVRLYGTARTLLLRNRYTPEDLITVMGADYNDIVSNLAQLRAYINTFAARMSAMRVPSDLHFIERHMWLFSHIFGDSQTDKCQLYVVNPGAFWEYKTATTAAETGFFLSEKVPMINALYTFERLTTFGNALLNSVLNSEDFNIMSGDILKAYGDKTFALNMIAEEYQVPVVYEPEFLLQLHNASVFEIETNSGTDSEADYMKWKIQQDYSETPNVGALTANFDISLKYNEQANNVPDPHALTMGLQQPLDVPVENPSPELVAIATRMKVNAVFTADVNGVKVMRPYAYGTEIIVGAWIFTKSPTTFLLDRTPQNYRTQPMRLCFGVLPVHYAYGGVNVSDGSISGDISIVGSIDNITMLPAPVLYNIHRAALLGMFGLAK